MSREIAPDASFSTTETKDDERSKSPIPEGTLRLRSEQTTRTTSRVSWTSETIDNEHMNKKKSNLCCIFHPKEDPDCPYRHEEPDPNAWNAYERQPNHPPKPPSNSQ